MVIAFVHDRPNQARTRAIDSLGILLLTISVGCIQYVLEHGERDDWFDSSRILWLSIVGVVAMGLLVWRELKIRDPVVDFRVLRHSQMAIGVVLAVIVGVGLYGSLFILPVFLQNMLHMTAFQTGMLVLPGAIASAAAMFMLGRIGDRLNPRLVICTGSILFAVAMWKFSRMTLESGSGDFFWPLIFRGLGLGLVFVPLSNIALADLSRDELPQGTGLYNFFRQLGGSFGIAAMASLLARFTSQADQVIRSDVVATSQVTLARVGAISRGLLARGIDPITAKQQAIAMISRQVSGQAAVIGYSKIYVLSGLMLLIALPLLLLVRHTSPSGGGGAVHAE
jgi:DHA2 family multidrug resistance protein